MPPDPPSDDVLATSTSPNDGSEKSFPWLPAPSHPSSSLNKPSPKRKRSDSDGYLLFGGRGLGTKRVEGSSCHGSSSAASTGNGETVSALEIHSRRKLRDELDDSSDDEWDSNNRTYNANGPSTPSRQTRNLRPASTPHRPRLSPSPHPPGSSSPRTVVATQFAHLALKPPRWSNNATGFSALHFDPLQPTSPDRHKRPRTSSIPLTAVPFPTEDIDANAHAPRLRGGTPEQGARHSSSSSSSAASSPALSEPSLPSSPTYVSASASALASASPATQQPPASLSSLSSTSSSTTTSTPTFTPSTPQAPLHSTPSFEFSLADRSSLTWQDAEITGHLAADPDDDGTGLNGVGFKPTPATAWARAQRRRRQIEEWRNREAREARARRAEGRKKRGVGGGVGVGLGNGAVGSVDVVGKGRGGKVAGVVKKRVVRFAS